MTPSDRRFGFRIPVDFFLDQYRGDKRYRLLATNISETGVFVHKTDRDEAAGETVALEIQLPGDAESIWARGEVRYDEAGELCRSAGIKFTAMAKAHARRLRDYCVETRRTHLGGLLAAIAS